MPQRAGRARDGGERRAKPRLGVHLEAGGGGAAAACARQGGSGGPQAARRRRTPEPAPRRLVQPRLGPGHAPGCDSSSCSRAAAPGPSGSPPAGPGAQACACPGAGALTGAARAAQREGRQRACTMLDPLSIALISFAAAGVGGSIGFGCGAAARSFRRQAVACSQLAAVDVFRAPARPTTGHGWRRVRT